MKLTNRNGVVVSVDDATGDRLLTTSSSLWSGDVSSKSASTDDGPTLADLKSRASELEIKGRSSMDKDELAAAVAAAES